MRKTNKLWLSLFLILGFSLQMMAQTHGTAAKPLVSTAENPIYYYIESAGGAYAGNVILPGDAVGEKLKHDALTEDNKESAKWQIVLEDGVPKLKNAQTGKYMSASHTYADTGERFDVRIYTDQNYYRIYNFGFTPTIAYNNNLLDRQGTLIPEMQWYFVVEPGSVANYNDGKGNYYTLYGRNEHTGRKLNSITFKVNDQLLKTVNIGQTYSGGPCYFDKTAEIVEVKPGDALSISFNWTGAWMHNFAYVDWDKSISFENEERLGHNSLGQDGEMQKPIVYTVPTEQALGEYRLRAMVDWDGAGYSTPNHVNGKDFYGGGSVTDFTLRVTNTPKPLPPTLPFGANTVIVKGDVITLTPPEGATVKYTTDDTDPATSATAIEGATITVSDNMKLRAIAVKDDVNSEELVRELKIIDITLGNEYYVVFQRYDGTLALEDMGDGNPMTTQTLDLGKAEQRWIVSKGASGALYKLTSLAGNVVYWNGSKFTVSATPAEDAEVDLRFLVTTSEDGYTGYEIQRKASTNMGMNPIGGSQVGKEIGEWYYRDGGNVVRFLSTKGLLLAEIEKAQALHDNVPVGNEFGQYPADAKTDLQTAIDAAQAEYDKPTSDGDLEAITAIQSAVNTFKTTINVDKNTLIGADRKYKWYTIRSTSTHGYVKDKVISSTGREEGNKFTFESKSDPVEDAQLFRFELDGDKVKLINKANGKYMAKNGAIAAEGALFDLNVLTDGYSFNIQPEGVDAIHAQQHNALIVNWPGVAGSASAWVFDFAFEEIIGLGKPIVSTAEKPVYYYIESASDGSVVLKAGERNYYLGHLVYAPSGDDNVQLKHDIMDMIPSVDNALWQLVSVDGVTKLQNKGTGLFMDEARFGRVTTTSSFTAVPLNEPATQYALKNSNQKSPAVAWYTEARGFYLDRWGSSAPNSQVAWFFFVEPESKANYDELLVAAVQADLLAKIESTQAILDKTSEGEAPGQFTTASREALQAVIDAAQLVHDDEAATMYQYNKEIGKLNEASNVYLQSGVKPVISNDETTKWYFIQGTRPANTYLTSTGEGAAILSKTVIPDDTQLWKFVENTNGTANGLAIVNKATGEYLDANATNAVNSVATMPENNLQLKMSDIFTNKVARFWIEHAEGSTPAFRLHAGQTSVLNWTGNAYDNSSWLIMEYTAALKDFLLASLNKANAVLGTVSEGVVYTDENKADFTLKVEAAQAVYDNPEATDAELISAKATLDEAFTVYKETAVVNPELLVSEKARNHRWYWIRSTSTHAYAADKVISAGTRAIGERFTFEAKAEKPKDEQLFRIELTEDKTKIKNLINKAGDTYMAANGTISETEVADNDFTLELLSDGVSLRIKPTSLNELHAQEANTHIVNWAGDAGSASAWSFDFAFEEIVGLARPIVSTEEKPVYYYIESASDGSVVLKAGEPNNYLGHLIYAPSGDDNVQLKHDLMETILDASISVDNALWQLVSVDGVTKLQNKGTGLFMDEARFGRVTTTSSFIPVPLNDPVTQYALRNSNQKSPAVAWYTEARGNYLDRWGSSAPNSQVAWFFFIEPGSKANYDELLVGAIQADLLAKIESTQAILDMTSEGDVPGQFTTASREALQAVIDVAQIVYDDAEATIDQYNEEIEKLKEASNAYLQSGVKPVISNDETTKWYFIQGTRPANTYLTSTGEGAAILSKTIIPDDTQLWKFVENTSGTANGLAMVNKATGEYLDANTAYDQAVNSVATMPENNLQLKMSDIFTNKVARFWIEHAEGSTPAFRLHAGNTAVLNWTGGAYDNSSWLILDYSVALKDFLLESLNKANAVLGTISEGIVYTDENKADFTLEVEAAQAVYDNSAATDEELISAKAALDEAFAAYKETAVVNPELLVSTDPSVLRWYWIRSTSTHAYATDKVISAGTRAVGERFTFEAKTEEPTDEQLFRVELTEDKTKIKNLINKAGDTYMAANGTISETEIADNDFTLELLSDGVSLRIKPATANDIHAQEANTHIVNWKGDAGSASAWSFDFALETIKVIDSTKELFDNSYVIRLNNGIITVDGVTEFEVYSITGQRVNEKATLTSGIYIVKVKEFTQKIIVK